MKKTFTFSDTLWNGIFYGNEVNLIEMCHLTDNINQMYPRADFAFYQNKFNTQDTICHT